MWAYIDSVRMGTMLIKAYVHIGMDAFKIFNSHYFAGNSPLVCNNYNEIFIFVKETYSFASSGEESKLRSIFDIVVLCGTHVYQAVSVKKCNLMQ